MGSYFLKAYIKGRIYYNTEEEFEGIRLNLKHDPCPHCRNRGCLVLHGYLYGYGESRKSKRSKRGHRIFCSNRNKRKGKGCGRTFSMLISGLIKNHIISAKSVWKLLDNIKEDKSLVSALRRSDSDIEEAGIYNIIRRFKNNQAKIRTLLIIIKDPPVLKHTKDSIIQTIDHLRSAFKGSTCPVSQFQYYFQTSFL
jgi:hypothetical protein